MKKLALTFCIAANLISPAHAGPDLYSTKSSKEAGPQPCPSWYADTEWNVSLWATYAFTDNNYPTIGNTISQGVVSPINGGSVGPQHDTYLESDHAWGGGIDAKYFFKRYFGFGIEGWATDVRRSFGTVTVLP